MIHLMKASAGSGKTYTLAHQYIDILMSSDDEFEYRHILAVTFTNKATAEMKGRILRDLYALSIDRTPENARKAAKASRILSNILHDYSAFAISTIDKFFQQTLRAFARELGRFASYQVELDSSSLIEETVDGILDSLDPESEEDRRLIGFILENMEDRLSGGKKPEIESDLKEMAVQLKSENFSVKAGRLGLDAEKEYSTENLVVLKKSCSDTVGSFEKGVVSRSRDILSAASSAGFSAADFNGGSRSWFTLFEKLSQHKRGTGIKALSDAFIRKASDPQQWFAASKSGKTPAAQSAIGGRIDDFLNWWGANFKAYNTALQILSNLYGLGIAAKLSSAFRQIQNEKNVVCLAESNTILKNIIDGSDAPFVYEKIGVRIRHFLLDEFQDTSLTQWDNFLPLLAESDANGGNNLIVGDVKQSIYRWRESDWSLLDSGVQEKFPGASVEELRANWRSTGEVINFNNVFYTDVALSLDGVVAGDGRKKISEIYSDVCQKVGRPERSSDGGVQTRFCADASSQLDAIVEAIRTAHDENGVRYGDMAILVRKNSNGTDVANRLIEENIPLVTEASLCIKNSLSVRRIVSLMSYVCNPDDKLNSRLAGELAISDVPTSYHSLVGLCEELYLLLAGDGRCREDLRNDVTYINAFVDYLMDYTSVNGNNLKAFLKQWAEKNPTISSPLGTDAVRILTIHKSKGLDFPFVIVPFLEGIELYDSRRTRAWCNPGKVASLPEGVDKKLFLVPLSSTSENTAFDEAYREERYNQCIDAINLMYVATTRASAGMLLLGTPKEGAYSNFADILSSWCKGQDMTFGKGFGYRMATSGTTDGAAETDKGYLLHYDVIPTGARLGIRPYAEEFFTSEGEGFDALSFRKRGIVLHDILSRVIFKEDLATSVEAAVSDGSLGVGDRTYVLDILGKAMDVHPEFFPDRTTGVRILTECPIIDADGGENRPDRVLIHQDGSVDIIDYKFGEYHSDYDRQLERYRSLFQEMGYGPVKTHLWFVNKNS